ncbi:MAG: hypothetical protein ASARMPREDX12_004154 [Alectoria sarmentosa]|nr:MAG: hypothetical protein ASARMPREDX12_004154 [Alectoria sarmentosa]
MMNRSKPFTAQAPFENKNLTHASAQKAINAYTTTLLLALLALSQNAPQTLTAAAATTSANSLSRFTNATQTLSIDVPLRVLLEEETYGFAIPDAPNAGFLAFLYAYPAVRTYGRSTSGAELVGLLQQRLSEAGVDAGYG